MKHANFTEWVKKQNDEFFAIANYMDRNQIYKYANGIANRTETNIVAAAISYCPYRVSVFRKRKSVVMQIVNMKKEKRGIAICNEDDAFDPAIGIAYAWARYKEEEIPKWLTYKKLDELKNGDVFYVGNIKRIFIGKTPAHKSYAYIDEYSVLRIGYAPTLDWYFSTET